MRALLAYGLLLTSALGAAQGGPPMITDDPGTPPIGKFELNLAYTYSRGAGFFGYELPLIDLAYGATRNLQLKVEMPWAYALSGGSSARDLGGLSAGFKWRFQDENERRPGLSIFPQFEGAVSKSSIRNGFAAQGIGLLFPLEIQWHRGKFGMNIDLGMQFGHGSSPQWFLGGAVSTMVSDKTELIGELHLDANFSCTQRDLIAQIGVRHELAEGASFIGSVGKSVATLGTTPTRLQFYVGIQLHF